MVMSTDEKKMTLITRRVTPSWVPRARARPGYKVTISPRGRAPAFLHALPCQEGDRYSTSKRRLES